MTSRADRLRGHEFLPRAVAAVIPRLYATEEVEAEDKLVVARWMTSAGGAEWLAVEYSPEERLFFGWCDLGIGGAEWGYFSRDELEDLLVTVRDAVIYVERDLSWSPRRFSEVRG